MKKTSCILISIFLIILYSHGDEDLRIMTYNVKDFWLRFDGESGKIGPQGGMFDDKDFTPLTIISSIINSKDPDVIAFQECASLGELLYFNKQFLSSEYMCWSFRYADHRQFGIPLGLLVKKELQVHSIELFKGQQFSSRGIIIAEISKDDYEFTLISVHLKSRYGDENGDTAIKRLDQVETLREKLKGLLNDDPDANIIICGDFNDIPGTDLEDLAGLEKDLLDEIAEPISLDDGQEVTIHNATLLHEDSGQYDDPWSEWHEVYGLSLFDYFFLTQGAYGEFKSINHIYPEEFVNIKEASDHIPIILDLKID